jgi:hypothetical protein
VAEDDLAVGVEQEASRRAPHVEWIGVEVILVVSHDDRECIFPLSLPFRQHLVLLSYHVEGNQNEAVTTVLLVDLLQMRQLRIACPSGGEKEVDQRHLSFERFQRRRFPVIGLQRECLEKPALVWRNSRARPK